MHKASKETTNIKDLADDFCTFYSAGRIFNWIKEKCVGLGIPYRAGKSHGQNFHVVINKNFTGSYFYFFS